MRYVKASLYRSTRVAGAVRSAGCGGAVSHTQGSVRSRAKQAAATLIRWPRRKLDGCRLGFGQVCPGLVHAASRLRDPASQRVAARADSSQSRPDTQLTVREGDSLDSLQAQLDLPERTLLDATDGRRELVPGETLDLKLPSSASIRDLQSLLTASQRSAASSAESDTADAQDGASTTGRGAAESSAVQRQTVPPGSQPEWYLATAAAVTGIMVASFWSMSKLKLHPGFLSNIDWRTLSWIRRRVTSAAAPPSDSLPQEASLPRQQMPIASGGPAHSIDDEQLPEAASSLISSPVTEKTHLRKNAEDAFESSSQSTDQYRTSDTTVDVTTSYTSASASDHQPSDSESHRDRPSISPAAASGLHSELKISSAPRSHPLSDTRTAQSAASTSGRTNLHQSATKEQSWKLPDGTVLPAWLKLDDVSYIATSHEAVPSLFLRLNLDEPPPDCFCLCAFEDERDLAKLKAAALAFGDLSTEDCRLLAVHAEPAAVLALAETHNCCTAFFPRGSLRMRGGMHGSECMAMLQSVAQVLLRPAAQAYLDHMGIPYAQSETSAADQPAASEGTASDVSPPQSDDSSPASGTAVRSEGTGIDPVMHELNAEHVLQAQMADLDRWDSLHIDAAAHGEKIYSIAAQGPSYSEASAQQVAETGHSSGAATDARESSYASMLGKRQSSTTAKRKQQGQKRGVADWQRSRAESAAPRDASAARKDESAYVSGERAGRTASSRRTAGGESSLYSSSTQKLREQAASLRGPDRRQAKPDASENGVSPSAGHPAAANGKAGGAAAGNGKTAESAVNGGDKADESAGDDSGLLEVFPDDYQPPAEAGLFPNPAEGWWEGKTHFWVLMLSIPGSGISAVAINVAIGEEQHLPCIAGFESRTDAEKIASLSNASGLLRGGRPVVQPVPMEMMQAMGGELQAHIAAFPASGVPVKPGMPAEELAAVLAAYAHIIPVSAEAGAAALAAVSG